jgi:hypothetical protein
MLMTASCKEPFNYKMGKKKTVLGRCLQVCSAKKINTLLECRSPTSSKSPFLKKLNSSLKFASGLRLKEVMPKTVNKFSSVSREHKNLVSY